MISLKDLYIQTQDSIISLQKTNLNLCEGTLRTCNELNQANTKTIQALNSKVIRIRRQRNAVAIIATGLLVGLILK
jgi:hypothetical protein